MMDREPVQSSAPDTDAESAGDFPQFDELVAALGRWSGSLPAWPPAGRVRAQWEQVGPRLDRARRELSRLLVVGVIGGTGTGKSTLVNALAGRDSSPASDVARPTTIHPVVVAAPGVDLSWLPTESLGARVVRSEAAAVANIVLVDCPDPDTQPAVDRAGAAVHRGTAGTRPSDGNHNRELLEAVLPTCDVLLLVSTAQKYRSWVVAREVAAFAPGRPLLFVQTHASRDPDIRDDWRRELESQGFVVPRLFRIDGLDAAARAAAGDPPDPAFRELLDAIDAELAGRAARRVRRTGSLDLAGWFLAESRRSLEPCRQPVAELTTAVAGERRRLEGVLAAHVAERLAGSRAAWQRLLTDEVIERWHGGPFAAFLRAVAAIGRLWPRVRAAGGGLVGRLLAGQEAAAAVVGRDGWQPVEELGLTAAEIEQSRSVLAGLAARARLAEPLVGRVRLDDSRAGETAAAVLEKTGSWLSAGIDRLVAARRGRLEVPALRWTLEALFSGLLVAVLLRAGLNFFVGHLWHGRPMDGGGFLQEALVWLVLWGLFLRWLVCRFVRSGLEDDIHALVSRVPDARLVDPLIADFASAADAASVFLDEAERLGREHESLAGRLVEPSGLGRLAGGAG